MADFTETPYAEDFAMELAGYAEELADLILEYRERGLSKEWIKTIFEETINCDELFDEDDD